MTIAILARKKAARTNSPVKSVRTDVAMDDCSKNAAIAPDDSNEQARGSLGMAIMAIKEEFDDYGRKVVVAPPPNQIPMDKSSTVTANVPDDSNEQAQGSMGIAIMAIKVENDDSGKIVVAPPPSRIAMEESSTVAANAPGDSTEEEPTVTKKEQNNDNSKVVVAPVPLLPSVIHPTHRPLHHRLSTTHSITVCTLRLPPMPMSSYHHHRTIRMNKRKDRWEWRQWRSRRSTMITVK